MHATTCPQSPTVIQQQIQELEGLCNKLGDKDNIDPHGGAFRSMLMLLAAIATQLSINAGE